MKKIYIVYRRKDGKRLVTGTSKQCASELGMTYGGFLSMVCKSKKKDTLYKVEVITDDSSKTKRAIAKWDVMINAPHSVRSETPYPCTGCAHRSICEVMDTHCKLWARWYSSAYTIAARQLEQAADGQLRKGDRDGS